jgi:hypothetical protein
VLPTEVVERVLADAAEDVEVVEGSGEGLGARHQVEPDLVGRARRNRDVAVTDDLEHSELDVLLADCHQTREEARLVRGDHPVSARGLLHTAVLGVGDLDDDEVVLHGVGLPSAGASHPA